MNEEERQRLLDIVEADTHIGRQRAFLGGMWRSFEDSHDEEQARAALEQLRTLAVDRRHPEPFQKVLGFLSDHFEWMTTYLRHAKVRRNSLAESGMRVLRRLEVEHAGLRTQHSRDNHLRIDQAVKYLGWSVHHPPTFQPSTPSSDK